ncbi:hypothetical protein B0H34DRAFT_651161 [Crassisporium funariophilum]|nr:hypothetical protein B0H34DRAFT_651161 [Crassisporium funariophilum]
MLPFREIGRRLIHTKSPSSICPPLPQGFSLWPRFLSRAEQSMLLAASLHKLDALDTRRIRRSREDFMRSRTPILGPKSENVMGLFAPDEFYEFQEGHFDGVIHHFRETHLSTWPFDKFEGLKTVVDRLYSLCPTDNVQTHLLHLASYGDILPHVDNVSASGTWILGVSLGDERILRMNQINGNQAFHVTLPSGSVYLQQDNVRFNYKHSIERECPGNVAVRHGQRLSVMIRVCAVVIGCDQTSIRFSNISLYSRIKTPPLP